MPTFNPDNERIKRKYFVFLKEAMRQSEDMVDTAAKTLSRYEEETGHRDFGSFTAPQAVAFKQRLAEQISPVTQRKLSKATMHVTLTGLKRFFQWLAQQPGHKSKLNYTDAEFFNLSAKDTRIATAERTRPNPTLEQIRHALFSMPVGSEMQRRDRAVMAFTLLTGARDMAIASAKLKHVDLAKGTFFQDARDVKTKFSKSFTTSFFPVGDDVRKIVDDWVNHLRKDLLWGNEDPVFPSTQISVDSEKQFGVAGLARKHWETASPIRGIFKDAFAAVDLPNFNPHSFRHTLVQMGETVCRSAEEFKCWSQNLGHEAVLTTFVSYGTVTPHRQAEIMRQLAGPSAVSDASPEAVLKKIYWLLQQQGTVNGRPESDAG